MEPMSDLTPSQWREVEKASIYLPGQSSVGRFIGLGVLRNILRKSKRTNDQNALLWVLYEDVLKQGGEMLGGWTKEDLHEYALGSYFGWDYYEAFGMKRARPKKRSSRLSKSEFSDFVEHFAMQMAEHGITLELPGEVAA
jgi:hypothetical protein